MQVLATKEATFSFINKKINLSFSDNELKYLLISFEVKKYFQISNPLLNTFKIV